MTLLALDPSSTCVGYAALTGLQSADLIEAGRLKPSMAKAAVPDLEAWQLTHLRAPELKAAWRIAGLVADALALASEIQPERIVIEIPSGLVGTGARRGASGSLTTLGLAAGAIWMALHQAHPGRVIPVTERQWTRARGRKLAHQQALTAIYPTYDPAQDPGADIADAIGLGRWELGRCALGAPG